MLDLAHELLRLAVAEDAQVAVLDLQLELASRKGADEHHLLGVLTDIDEAAGSREARAELAHVQIALLVRLGEAEECGIGPAAVIEVELIGLIDDGLRIDGGSEIEPARRHAADDARLG